MSYKYNKNLFQMHKPCVEICPPEEKHLWYDFLKRLPVTVYRQKNMGNYIVDFYVASKCMVIEIDGSQHNLQEHKKADFQRDCELHSLGITVLRYRNIDVNENFYTVCNDILNKLNIPKNELKPLK